MLHAGGAAQARLREIVPALVILDLNLPRVSGRELLDQIRADERLRQTHVIITSGDTQTAALVVEEGKADLVLIKPISREQLRDFALRIGQPLPPPPAAPAKP